jgi:hypothetical protein
MPTPVPEISPVFYCFHKSPTPYVTSLNTLVSYSEELLIPSPKTQVQRSPLVGYSQLLTRYIRSCPPQAHLQCISPIRNLSMRHASVKKKSLNKNVVESKIVLNLCALFFWAVTPCGTVGEYRRFGKHTDQHLPHARYIPEQKRHRVGLKSHVHNFFNTNDLENSSYLNYRKWHYFTTM